MMTPINQFIAKSIVPAAALMTAVTLTACDNSNTTSHSTADDSAAVHHDGDAQPSASSTTSPTDADLERNPAIDSSNVDEKLTENADGDIETQAPANAQTDSSSTQANTQANATDLVSGDTQPNTPEHTVKQALNTLYYGNADDAVKYYQVDIPNFAQELSNTQYAFQQTVEHVELTDTQYNESRNQAHVNGTIKLKGEPNPVPLRYDLKKVDGEWKILG